MQQADPFAQLADALRSDQPLSDELLHLLSGLEADTLTRFESLWAELDAEDRANLVTELRDAAEANLALDYVAICKLAMVDPDPAVRTVAFELAAEDASPDLFEFCLEAAERDPDREARTSAVQALGVFTLEAQADGWAWEQQARAQHVLLAALRGTKDLELRQAALLSLAYLTTPEVETEIRRAYADPELRPAGIRAMGRNCQDIWLPYLEAELRAADEEHRLEAVLACAEMEDERLAPGLIERLRDRSQDVRLAAIHALSVIGGDEAEAALSAVERAGDEIDRQAAREALEEVRGRDLLDFEEVADAP